MPPYIPFSGKQGGVDYGHPDKVLTALQFLSFFRNLIVLAFVYSHNSLESRTLENIIMKRIILVLLIVAGLYAMNVWAQNPVLEQEITNISNQAEPTSNDASFTLGGLLIMLSIGLGYLAKKIYVFRNLNER